MRILVIEDDPDLLRTITRILRETGYAVDAAEDGQNGLAKAELSDYDLILLDVLLPKLNGWEVLGKLRKTKNTPVLMLTARDALSDRVRGLNTGADDYQTKPFEFDELLARINALIRRSAGKSLPKIEINEVLIDTCSRKVFCSEKEIVLTAREYSLLEYLALHRGQVVTKAMLYEHLLDDNDDSMSNLMEVYVSNIRRKVSDKLIVTRRGLGYCIE